MARSASMTVKPEAAYDLSRFDGRALVRGAKDFDVERETTAKKEKRAVRIPFFGIFSYIVVIVLAVTALMYYIQLTEITDTTVHLKNEIAQLQSDNETLRAASDKKYDCETISKIATEQYGMVQIDKTQVTYVDLSAEDSSEVLLLAKENKSSLGLAAGFRELWEYFR